MLTLASLAHGAPLAYIPTPQTWALWPLAASLGGVAMWRMQRFTPRRI